MNCPLIHPKQVEETSQWSTFSAKNNIECEGSNFSILTNASIGLYMWTKIIKGVGRATCLVRNVNLSVLCSQNVNIFVLSNQKHFIWKSWLVNSPGSKKKLKKSNNYMYIGKYIYFEILSWIDTGRCHVHK